MRPGGTVRTTLRGGGRPRPAVSHRRRRPLRLLFLSPFPVEETLPRFPCTALRWRPAEGSPSSPVVTSWATSPPCPQTLLRDQQPSLRLRLVLFGSLPVFCGFHAGGKSDGVCVSRVCVPPPAPLALLSGEPVPVGPNGRVSSFLATERRLPCTRSTSPLTCWRAWGCFHVSPR